jgi:hypothetical protein
MDIMTEVINVKILHLVLKKKWYEMQERGEKTEEYREITPYWYQRLYQRKKEFGYAGRLTRDDAEYCCDPGLRYILIGEGFADTELKPYTHVCFHYGYTQRCFINRIDSITIGRGNPEWGAPADRDVFIIKHHREPSPFVVGKDFKR